MLKARQLLRLLDKICTACYGKFSKYIAPTEKWSRKSKKSKTGIGKPHMIATLLKVTLSKLWVSEPNVPIFNHKFLTSYQA